MMSYGDGMTTTETGPEVRHLQLQKYFEHVYVSIFSTQFDKYTMNCKSQVLNFRQT
jgi:hypothetical protein